MNSATVHLFEREACCSYRGEDYSVRDNGAVFRRTRNGTRKRPLDEIWTFGTLSQVSGYTMINTHRVHQIVATAFHGPAPTIRHIVDHIDTNRRNNRPENLRWVTRLENILLNPITAKRVKYHYGSIESFLANPKEPIRGELPRNFEWMRAVTKEESAYSYKRFLTWAKTDNPSKGGSLGDWVFQVRKEESVTKKGDLVKSLTPGAVQRNWRTPAEFPLSPKSGARRSLISYYEKIEEDAVFGISRFGQTRAIKAALSTDKGSLFVLGAQEGNPIKPWSLARVTHEGEFLVHESCGTFFTPEGAEKQYTLVQGLPWEGGDTFDDLC